VDTGGLRLPPPDARVPEGRGDAALAPLDTRSYHAAHMSRQVFVSHASVDAHIALAICTGLESRGLSCWIAPRDVAFTGTYGSEIVKSLRECDVVLIVVTDAAAASQQVEREAERASHYQKRIIPVIVGRSDPGPRLEFYVAGRQQFPCPPAPDERFFANLTAAIQSGAGRDVAATPPERARSIRRRSVQLAAAAVLVLGVAVAGYVFSRPPAPDTATQVVGDATAAGGLAGSQTPTAAPSSSDRGADGSPRAQPPVDQSANTRASRTGVASADVRKEPEDSRGSPAASPTTSGRGGPLVVDGVRLNFVAIPAGTFRKGCMDGDDACRDDEKPASRVSVDAFQMSATEVTQDFWQAVMGSNPSDFNGAGLPVEHVSWQDAQAFVERLNGRGDGFRYRLPTEAEWEYAARAGETTPPNLAAVAWFGLTMGAGRTQPVGRKSANGWGLYDMFGNVAEWCEDWYSPNYQRVVKGGAWDDSATSLRASARDKAATSTRVYRIGVRLARTPE
jgi:hypothetical protein